MMKYSGIDLLPEHAEYNLTMALHNHTYIMTNSEDYGSAEGKTFAQKNHQLVIETW